MLALALLSLTCIPNPTMRCSREYAPVCADKTEYSNLCQAQAAGFVDECASAVVLGPCTGRAGPQVFVPCPSTKFLSESTRTCVDKPWSDFHSCEIEKGQGACPGGHDPNPWVGIHCAVSCA